MLPAFSLTSNHHLSLLFFGGTLEVKQVVNDGLYKNGNIKKKTIKVPVKIKGLGLTPAAKSETATKGIYSVNEERLLKIKHPIAQKILEMRGLEKQLNTYYASFAELVYPTDGCVHQNYQSCLTATGRSSCVRPNVQNQGGGESPIKQHFVSRFKDGEIVSADYSQLEIRVQAQMCKDEVYMDDINKGVDFHCVEQSTEILTKEGWKRAIKITKNDLVASYSGTAIVYSYPEDVFKQKNRQLFHVVGDLSEELVSDHHSLYVDNKRQTVESLSTKIKQTRFTYSGQNVWDNYSGYTDNEIRLLIWALTDAHVFKRVGTQQVNGIRWKLSKPRKIQSLVNLLIEMDIPFKVNKCPKTGVNKLTPCFIIVYGEWQNWIFNQIGFTKQYPKALLKISQDQAKIVYDTLAITDGSLKDQHLQMVTTNLAGADLLQRLFILNGIACKLNYKQYKTKFNANVNVRLYAYPKIYDRRYVTIKEAGKGDVVGITTSTGTLITRRNGKVQVTGNCKRLAMKEGKTYEEVSLAFNSGCQVTKKARSAVKGFSFARAYGAGPKKIAEQTGLSLAEIDKIIKEEAKTYPVLDKWNAYNKETVERQGYYTDPWGQRYCFTKYPNKFAWQTGTESYNPNEMLNYIIQGFATGIVVFVMIGIFWRQKALYNRDRYLMINTVHDSLMLDCKKTYLRQAAKDLTILEDVGKVSERDFNYKFIVPIKVDIEAGKTWYDLKKLTF